MKTNNFLFLILVFIALACEKKQEPINEHVPLKEFKEKLAQNNGIILDVRTPQEFEQGHIPNATLIDFLDINFKENLSQLDQDKTYFIYCKAGGRSQKTAELMGKLGFKRIIGLEGGYTAWSEQINE